MKKILRVNMANQTIIEDRLPEEYLGLGGRALIARMLLNEIPPACEPLGRHNKLIFAPGLLGGSKVFSSGRISIGGKSPLTGGIKESNGGGTVGLKLGRLGYSAVVVEELTPPGKSFCLKITQNGAELLDASEYWGLGVYDATAKLRERFGKQIAVSCIGPAGEMRLTGAGVANTDTDGVPSRYCGRGGLGALMGSKRLKAVVIDDTGSKFIEPAKPDELTMLMKLYSQYVEESPVINSYKSYGTASMVMLNNALGGLPTRNFSEGSFEGAEKISGEKMHDIIVARKGKLAHACMPGCPMRCSNVYVDEQGEPIVAPLEYETIALMGSNLGIDDLDAIARLNYWCNDLGLDTIETGAALGVAMESGWLSFGDAEGAIKLMEEIGKGTIAGRVIAMGADTTSKVLGMVKRPVVKGQAMAGYDPRSIKGTGVTYATSPMGADHTAGATPRANIKHTSPEGQADLSKKVQNTIPIYDDLGLCMVAGAALGAHLDLVAQIVSAQLGINYNVDDLFEMTGKTLKWEVEFNRRAGFTNLDDRIPEYFCEVPCPTVNTVFDVSDQDLDGVHA